MTEEPIYPDFEKIIPKCLRELEIKFEEYGNDWMKLKTKYWIKRINNEVEEYEKSMTQASAKRKLINIMNMCAMAIDNLDSGRMEHETLD